MTVKLLPPLCMSAALYGYRSDALRILKSVYDR